MGGGGRGMRGVASGNGALETDAGDLVSGSIDGRTGVGQVLPTPVRLRVYARRTRCHVVPWPLPRLHGGKVFPTAIGMVLSG